MGREDQRSQRSPIASGAEKQPSGGGAGGEIGRDAKVCSRGGGHQPLASSARGKARGTPPPPPLISALVGRRCQADACGHLICQPADAVVALVPHQRPDRRMGSTIGDTASLRELNAPRVRCVKTGRLRRGRCDCRHEAHARHQRTRPSGGSDT